LDGEVPQDEPVSDEEGELESSEIEDAENPSETEAQSDEELDIVKKE
ncbi:hypothetical protein ADUPG1_004634, partial [Aduncisulcus paluster]